MMRTIFEQLFKLCAIVVVFVLTGTLSLIVAQTMTINELQRSFERPPDDSRIMMRWWWFGPAVTN